MGVLVEALGKLIPRKKKPVNPNPYRPVPAPKHKSWWAKNYIWVLIVFKVLIIIGLITDEETYYDDTIDDGGGQVENEFSQADINQLRE